MNNLSLVIGLSVALLLAVGFVVFFVGRVVLCIVADARAARRPLRQMQHAELGTLKFDSGLWGGNIARNGKELRITLAGTESGPDDRISRHLRETIDSLDEQERCALEFLHGEYEGLRERKFSLEGLDYLWERNPDAFAMEFSLAGDEYAIWRVEFDDGVPKNVGRDD